MPNLFAYLMLILWPVISLAMFRRLQTVQATLLTIIGGYLILPTKVAIDLPLIPPLDKNSISAIAALIGCIFIKKVHLHLIPRGGIERWFVIIIILSPFVTTLTNFEPVFDGDIWIPGLSFHDAFSNIINKYITLIPFMIGLQIFKNYDEQLLLFKYLVMAGVCYALPILFEIRMSPQLHTWIYGFFPHVFSQQIRDGGFRAVVFLGHGLHVGIFIAITIGAATTLWKNRINTFSIPALLILVFLILISILQKSLGATIFAIIFVITIRWIPNILINRLAQIFIVIVLLYPMLTILELFPHQELVDFIAGFNTERADSLAYRFFNENTLTQHAQDKYLFGWGFWGRNRFWNSVTDGYWIVSFGINGIIGFGALFGLSAVSIWKGVRASKTLVSKSEMNVLSAHMLIVSIIMVDQLPNASITGYFWLIIGALLGRSNNLLNDKLN